MNSAVEQRRQKEFRLKGPNVGRILDKVTFAFFTGPFTFELDVRHENIPVVVVVERRSWGWLVSRVRLPVAALLDGPR